MPEKFEHNIKENDLKKTDKLDPIFIRLWEINQKLSHDITKKSAEIEALEIENRKKLKKLAALITIVVLGRNYGNQNQKLDIFHPPKLAEYLLYLFIPKHNRNAILGDLEEEFREVYEKFGFRKAKFFYWWQVARSIWPLISDGVLKLLKLIIGIVTKFAIGK